MVRANLSAYDGLRRVLARKPWAGVIGASAFGDGSEQSDRIRR